MADDALVVFTPSGRRGRARLGTTVLETARALGVDIDSVCGTRGICGRCQVVQSVGDFAKHGITSAPGNQSGFGAKEVAYAERRGMAEGRRLACTAEVQGDLVIDVPAESQVHRQVVRKSLDLRRFRVDPVIKLHYVEVVQPDLASPSGDLARLLAALEAEWGLRDLAVDLEVVRGLQKTLRAGAWGVTVAVHDGHDVIAVWSGLREAVFGIAVDVGSTTIAGHLANLGTGAVLASAGLMNPQIRFGEDLMSRVSYAMLNDDGAVEMTKAVRGALDELVDRLVDGAGVERDDVLELTLVGNPIMHHLFLGIDPVELGSAPFALATDAPVRTTARDLGLGSLRSGARAYVLPCIAGHVGADTAGVILADEPHLAEPIRLLVDVGTNAEIVLGNRDRLLAASSPTGPAFEGAQISCGQRAAPGAIERVRVDPVSLEPRFKVIGCNLWSDEAGFAEATADLGITGICGSGIIEAMAELFLAGVITTDGVINGELAARTPRIVPSRRTFSYVLHEGAQRITVTQDDVRAIQLAKAALYAGARLLMDELGIDTVDEVRLAGAFGSHIDPMHAMVLGLIPDCDLARVSSIGNAAGTGALIALLARDARAEIEAVVRRVEKVETAVEPRFQAHFVEALAIPHKTAPSTFLAQAVALPAPSAASSGGRDGGRRRARPATIAPAIDITADIDIETTLPEPAAEPEPQPEETR
jgi:uncharacterized 2Fe-2S/4Fe-4S cluster protein (DUF4445 family)